MNDTEEQQQQHDDNNNDGHGRQKETTETAATASLLANGNKANVNDAKDEAEPRTPRDQTRTTMAASTSTQLAVPTTPATMPVTGGKFKDAPPELVIQLLRDGIIAEPEYDTMPLAVLVNTNEGQAGHPKAQAPQRTRVDLVGPHFARPMKHHHNPWKPPASEEDAVPGLLSVLTPAVVFGHRGRRNAWSRRHPENDKPSKIVASRYCEGQFLDARHVRDEDHDVEAHGVYEGTYYELLNSLQALLAYLQGLADVPPLLEPPEPPEIAELVLPPYKPPPAEQDPPDIEAPEFDEPEFMPPDGEPMPKMPDAGLLDLPADPGPRPAAYRPAAFKAPARERIKAYVEPDGEAVPAKPALVEEPQEEEEPDIEGVPEIGPAPEHPGDAPADATQPEYVEPEMPERPSEPVEDAPDTKSEVSEDEPMPPHVMEPKPMLQFIPEHLAVRPQPVCELCGDPGHTAPFCPRGKEPCARCGRPYQSEKCTVCGEFGHIAEFCPVDRCARCGEFGHKAHECPDKMRCGRCGEKGHTADVCPRMTCTRCGKEGHRAKFCPRDRCIVCGEYEPKPEPCELCGDMGHTAANCPHGKPIPCTLCGKMGHTAPFCPDAVCQLCGEPGHTADVCPTLRCGRCGDTGHKTEDCPRIHTQFPIYHKADAPLHLNWNPPFEEAPPKYPEPPEIPPPPFDGIPPGAPPERRNPDDLEVEPPFVEPSGEYDAGPKPEEPTLLEPNYPDVGAEPTYQEEPDFVAPIDDDLPEFVPPTEPRPIGYIAAEGRWWGYAPCMIFDHSGTMRFRKEGEPKSRFEDLRECQEMIFAHAPPLLGQLHASCAAFDAIVFTHGSWSFAYDAAGLASRAAKDRALYERHKGGERLPRGAGATWSGYSSTSGRGKGKSAISKLVHGTGNTQYTRRGTGSLPSGALIASADGVGSEAVVSKRPLTPSTQGVGTEPLVEERSYLRHSSTTLDLEQRNSSGNIWPEMRPGTAPSKLRAGHRVVDKPTGSKHPMLNFSWESHKNPPVECTPMMLDAAKQWLFRWPNARGASNMLGALIKGLESAPEAIYLFSDGLADSRRKVIELVEEYMAIGRCPPIHVIGFQCNAMGENLLRTLADMSGGSFPALRAPGGLDDSHWQ
ncbi:cellular nucleic acid-binding protein [Pycnococcus provasolii]